MAIDANDFNRDIWYTIAKHTPYVNKANLALVNRATAAACREAWDEADYFDCAGQPNMPAHLRVAHGQAAAGDTKAWLSLTQQLHHAGSPPYYASKRFPNQPVKALMALARQAPPSSRESKLYRWAQYEAALIGAHRPKEAEPFTRLLADAELLEKALRAGDVVTLERLLEADIPLPADSRILIPALESHPGLGNLLVNALLQAGELTTLTDVFCNGSATARDALLATDAFLNQRDVLFAVYKAASRYRGRHTKASALTALVAACTPEQEAALLTHVAAVGFRY